MTKLIARVAAANPLALLIFTLMVVGGTAALIAINAPWVWELILEPVVAYLGRLLGQVATTVAHLLW